MFLFNEINSARQSIPLYILYYNFYNLVNSQNSQIFFSFFVHIIQKFVEFYRTLSKTYPAPAVFAPAHKYQRGAYILFDGGIKYMRKFRVFNITRKDIIFGGAVAAIFLAAAVMFGSYGLRAARANAGGGGDGAPEYIRWLEFNFRLSSLERALEHDIKSFGTETPLCWIELLAYAAARNWGNVREERTINGYIDSAAERLRGGAALEELTEGMELYAYFFDTYYAVLGGFVGEFEVVEGEAATRKYGLKVFSPIAKGFGYSHYDDFGNARAYGYRRRHLGNDLLGSVGTPIIAVEDGYVEALGWNQYGGWRVGIRTLDRRRYYYYAHLRKDHPFRTGLQEGDFVQAGDVIGYLGMTGYSRTENVNNIATPHLHFGMQIIFDEVQKDGVNQIWIDVYNIIRLLSRNRMSVARCEESKDYDRAVRINNIVTD